MEAFILNVPKWQGEITFSYGMVSFLIVIALLLVGLVLCFMGYKYLQTLCIVVLGCLSGATGIWIGDRMTDNPILKMCFFVMFTFLGVCLFNFISILIVSGMKKMQMQYKFSKWQYLISAILGAGLVSIVTYLRVYHSIPVAVALFVGLTAVSAFWGKKQALKRKIFYTYNDLYDREPLQEKGAKA